MSQSLNPQTKGPRLIKRRLVRVPINVRVRLRYEREGMQQQCHCRSDGLQPCEKKPAERGVRDGIPLSDCHGYSLIGYSFFLFETRSSARSISNVSSNVFPKETAVWRSSSSSDMPRFRAFSLSPLGHCIFSGHRLINSLLSSSSEPILL